jgi:hypothetical protein
MPEGSAAATTTTNAAASATTTAPWYQGVDGVDSEMVGHWTNAGWHTKSAAEVAREATKAWKAAEKHVGVPADQILRIPKDPSDESGWKAVHTRLGAPNDAKEYDFSSVKFSDGSALEEGFVEAMRAKAFSLHLPKDAAVSMAQEVAKYLDSTKTSEKTELAGKLAAEKSALAKNWGPNFEANKFVATRAVQALGLEPEVVNTLEGVVGYAKVMEMFRSIGERIGEHKFVTSQAPGAPGVMTRDQAVARKQDLMSDSVWSKSYMEGDKAKQREMLALSSIISGIPVPPELMEYVNQRR